MLHPTKQPVHPADLRAGLTASQPEPNHHPCTLAAAPASILKSPGKKTLAVLLPLLALAVVVLLLLSLLVAALVPLLLGSS